MRKAFCDAILNFKTDPGVVFLTGDLGFAALEPIQDALGSRFINAGVAEQNMVGVAAGMASEGLNVWAYSIAPFIFARALEQIRNDIALHRLPVKLVGNGGGYGYGVMGPTHHAIDDYGILLSLQSVRVLIPAFKEDVDPIVRDLASSLFPCYLRLGRREKPKEYNAPAFSRWRKLLDGDGPVLLAIGPMTGYVLDHLLSVPNGAGVNLWTLGELPVSTETLDQDFLSDIRRSRALIVAEEHVANGSVGQQLLWTISQVSGIDFSFQHHFAKGYPSGRYGSQEFHRKESGLDIDSILHSINLYASERS